MAKQNKVWIIDGHNVIFAVPELERLQDSNRKREAREALAEACRRFAVVRQERVVIVFDGVPGFTQGTLNSTLLEVAFAAYEGKADDRIVLRADTLVQEGCRVHIATDDQDLRRRVHANVAAVGSQAFWRLTQTKHKPTGEDIPRIPLADVEEYFLEHEDRVIEEIKNTAPKKVTKRPVRGPLRSGSTPPRLSTPTRKVAAKARPSGSPPFSPSAQPAPSRDDANPTLKTPALSPEETLRRKKERGKRKQARRLARRRRPNPKRR